MGRKNWRTASPLLQVWIVLKVSLSVLMDRHSQVGSADGKVLLWNLTQSTLNQTPPVTANEDVNGDGMVDIIDLVLVANAFGDIAAAPAMRQVVSPAIGATVPFNFEITGGQNVKDFEFTLDFDLSALKYISTRRGDYLTNGVMRDLNLTISLPKTSRIIQGDAVMKNFVISADQKATFKAVLNTICLFLVFFLSANNVWGEIEIEGESLLEWVRERVLGSPDHSREPLRPGEFKKFKATAFQTNPHDFLSIPDVQIGSEVIGGIEPDPEIGSIEFSVTGGGKLSFFSNAKRKCRFFCGKFTHSVKYKWDTPGQYTVTAKVFAKDGNLHDSVEWNVQVGEDTFEILPDLPSDPSVPEPPSVQVSPAASDSRSGYIDRVGSDMTFKVQATSDDGIASIEFLLYENFDENLPGSPRLIGTKDDFLFPKGILGLFPPSFTVTHTWETPGEHRMVAKVKTKTGGLREVMWNIEVRGPNQPPTKIIDLSLIELGALRAGGKPGTIDIYKYFSDPEGNPLWFDKAKVNPSTSNIVTLKLIENRHGLANRIEIQPKNPGTALFYVVVREQDGLIDTQHFMVRVEPEQARAPVAVDTIPAQTLTIGTSSPPLDLSAYFQDPEDNRLTYTIASENPTVATAQNVGLQITIWAWDIGNTMVTVTATNPDGLSVTQTLAVTVTALPVQNQGPEPVGTIDHQSLLLDGPSQTLDVAQYFSPNNNLNYEVSVSPSGIVEASVSGSRVTITPRQLGNASVVAKAYDSNDRDLYAIQTIPVLVYTDHATIVRQPPAFTPTETSHFSAEGLEDGVAVIVQNTIGQGLNIRSNPWVSNNNPDNRIGKVHDGATGTITDGPSKQRGVHVVENRLGP